MTRANERPAPLPIDGKAPALAAPLLAWYERVARPLPWRVEPTPYRVWVSEVMLQQTRVAAVLGYFERFMRALPGIRALAEIDEQALFKLWEGLGYYSRARNLQAAARVVVEKHGGGLPADYAALRALPGVGDYTAGAVASIAFGIAAPAVDGNVLRVLARVFARGDDIARPEVKEAFRDAARALLPPGRPGDFNQALMELGATVCVPGAPRCGECPIAALCEGHAKGVAASLPVKAAKKPRIIEERAVLCVTAGGRALLRRREGKGLLSGLWEPPCLEGTPDEAAILAALRVWGAAGDIALLPLGEARHIFTHREWHMRGFLARCAPFGAPDGWAWAAPDELRDRYAVPSAYAAFAAALEGGAG